MSGYSTLKMSKSWEHSSKQGWFRNRKKALCQGDQSILEELQVAILLGSFLTLLIPQAIRARWLAGTRDIAERLHNQTRASHLLSQQCWASGGVKFWHRKGDCQEGKGLKIQTTGVLKPRNLDCYSQVSAYTLLSDRSRLNLILLLRKFGPEAS